jgi:hypothetical protein
VDCRAKTVKGGLNPSPKKRLFGGIPGITAICPLKKPKPQLSPEEEDMQLLDDKIYMIADATNEHGS